MSYISDQIINSRINLFAKDINSDIDNIIRIKLKDEVEGKGNECGYIIKDSIKIIKRSIGQVTTLNNKSMIKYALTYSCKIISPSPGDIIKSYISNINKMGVISYIKLNDDDIFENSPMIIMIPKEYFNNSTRNFEDLTIGQSLEVSVIGSREKWKNDKISIVAKPN
jgi:DNA-directed RNA polymerase subunit E'/Rpb7|tara:strand:+ start:479 stop:979 length:501 start_codon:yes stop_codon:yes gene_type:complete